jgi:hypothetical protein
LVLGKFYRRPGSLGSAWSPVKVSKYKRKRGGESIAREKERRGGLGGWLQRLN